MAARSNQPASVARRIVAVMLDGVVAVVVGGLVWLVIPGHDDFDLASTSMLYAAALALYEMLLIAWFGQTAGKAVVGIAVVNDAGENPTIVSSAIRYVVKSLQPLLQLSRWFGDHARVASAFISVGWDVVLLLSIASDERGQGLHDRVAGTWVVNVTRREPLSTRLSGRSKALPALTVLEQTNIPKGRARHRR